MYVKIDVSEVRFRTVAAKRTFEAFSVERRHEASPENAAIMARLGCRGTR
jgi:hypothetical protein